MEGERIMLKRIKEKKWSVINCIAMMLVFATANSTCLWYYHQPEFPKEADFMRKYNND